MQRTAAFGLILFAFGSLASAFDPPRAKEGPLGVEIVAPDKVATLGKPFTVEARLTNSGAAPLDVSFDLVVIDDFHIEPDGARRAQRSLRVPAHSKRKIEMEVVAGRATYNAHYPIHAFASFADPDSGERRKAHAIKILVVEADRVAKPAGPLKIALGATSLVDRRGQRVSLRVGSDGTTRTLGRGWHGSDAATGGHFAATSVERAGRRMACLAVHPPWRKGWGTIWADYDLVLPNAERIELVFWTAIGDHRASGPPSDGVEFRVLAWQSGGDAEKSRATARLLFRRFTKSKNWERASVDLTDFAGRRTTVRLWIGPGPAHNTACDLGYWGNPLIVAGRTTKPLSEAERNRMLEQAVRRATEARSGRAGPWTWRLQSTAGSFGAAVVPGHNGLADAAIAICGEQSAVLLRGFQVQVDDLDIENLPLETGSFWTSGFAKGRGWVRATLLCNGRPVDVRTDVWSEGGALRFRFSMPGVERDEGGRPRFTLIGIGPALGAEVSAKGKVAQGGLKARRVYAGFGNVLEEPGRFTLPANGFRLSTRHVGVDFENGLSLVEASDIFPDRLLVDPRRCLYSLQAHHDATISLIPSDRGAFAAARVYREDIAGFEPAPGVARLLGRMCLDFWGGDYRYGIRTIKRLARYGVTDCVLVWHNWQRWGYDYRLPDIYPARGSHGDFVRLAETCRRHGVLFAPHDNYIDFYPDAEGFSYEHIIFNRNRTPQRAWYNRGRKAQSYRWLPHAFRPWLERNVALLGRDVRPTAYFIDVFSAIGPMDYYDRRGRFYPKTETIRRWAECFDYVREALGGAPQISEAGHDALIGHLDGGEADHPRVAREGTSYFAWRTPCADAERVPWHDMASHGSFVLFAGGLAQRYAAGLDLAKHGYGSDDYLSLTVLGGRNPMAHLEASAATVRTYWLLHDICAELGRRPMTSHEFANGDIHRQAVRFGPQAVVHVNRGEKDWEIEGVVLPQFGFTARAGSVRADISRRQGRTTAYAESPEALFADARPGQRPDRKVINFGAVATDGAFRLIRTGDEWQLVLLPGCPPCEIRLSAARLSPPEGERIARIERIAADGSTTGEVAFARDGEWVVFRTVAADFGFRIIWR